jgi:hypothetical protein
MKASQKPVFPRDLWFKSSHPRSATGGPVARVQRGAMHEERAHPYRTGGESEP